MTLPITDTRLVFPTTFHFAEPGKPCSYWGNGNHIVSEGKCRCGKFFELTEELPAVKKKETV